jgi:galactokinase
MFNRENLVDEFKLQYNCDPDDTIMVPGCVDLMGYLVGNSDGHRLTFILEYGTMIAFSKRDDRVVNIRSMNNEIDLSFSLDKLTIDSEWSKYSTGIAWAISEFILNDNSDSTNVLDVYNKKLHGSLVGFNAVIVENLQADAELSERASLEIALAQTFQKCSDIECSPSDLAFACDEFNKYSKEDVLIQDLISLTLGKPGKAIYMDCSNYRTEILKMLKGTSLMIIDSKSRHLDPTYIHNNIDSVCKEASNFYDVASLKDLAIGIFAEKMDSLTDNSRKISNFILDENDRVMSASDALRFDDPFIFGQLMNESHETLKKDMELTSSPINDLMDIITIQDSCYGARLTGKGPDGCIVALIDSGVIPEFMDFVSSEFEKKSGINVSFY